jgi:hypothetical protein
MIDRSISLAALLAFILGPMTGCLKDRDTSGGDGSQDTPLLWNDPQGGGGGGGGGEDPLSDDTLAYEATGCPLRTQTADTSITTPENELYYQITQYRQILAGGLPGGITVVAHATDLREIERAHCKHMNHCFLQDGSFFNLVNPEGDNANARLDLNTIPWITSGEIIEGGYADAAEAFSAMEADPGKKAILDDANWTRVGCGFWPGTAPLWGALFVM